MLIKQLRAIKPGQSEAGQYHTIIQDIFNFLFHRILVNPQKEQKLEGGMKRADIVYSNEAKGGFFWALIRQYNVHSPYVVVECKNYGADLENPEYDQICGRLSRKSGMFGIITCRKIANHDKATKQCKSIVAQDRGYVIVMDDDDLVSMINMRIENPDEVDTYLEATMRKILF
jgi:hypothetical protein